MPKSATMTVRLSRELDEKLAGLARERKRSKADLASEAIAAFVDVDAWQVGRIKESLDEAKSGAPGVRHEDVVRWVESWDTEHELPRPQPKKSWAGMDIVWRRMALDDLEAARRYIAEHNPGAAARVHGAILASVGRLATHPNLGRPGRVVDTRELAVPGTPYIVAISSRMPCWANP